MRFGGSPMPSSRHLCGSFRASVYSDAVISQGSSPRVKQNSFCVRTSSIVFGGPLPPDIALNNSKASTNRPALPLLALSSLALPSLALPSLAPSCPRHRDGRPLQHQKARAGNLAYSRPWQKDLGDGCQEDASRRFEKAALCSECAALLGVRGSALNTMPFEAAYNAKLK